MRCAGVTLSQGQTPVSPQNCPWHTPTTSQVLAHSNLSAPVSQRGDSTGRLLQGLCPHPGGAGCAYEGGCSSPGLARAQRHKQPWGCLGERAAPTAKGKAALPLPSASRQREESERDAPGPALLPASRRLPVPPGAGAQAGPGPLRGRRAQTWGAGAGRTQVPGPVGLGLALAQPPDGLYGPAQGVGEEPRAAGREGPRGQAGSQVPPEAQPPGDHAQATTPGSRVEAGQRSPRGTGETGCSARQGPVHPHQHHRVKFKSSQTPNNEKGCWNLPSHPAWLLATADRRGQRCPGHGPTTPWQVSPPEPRTSISLPDTCRPALGAGKVAEHGRLAETQRGAPLHVTQHSPCAGEKEPQLPRGPVRTDAGYHGPKLRCSLAPPQRHRLREAADLTTGAGDTPSLHCPQPSPAKQTPSPGGLREGPCGTCQGACPPRCYKSLGCKI